MLALHTFGRTTRPFPDEPLKVLALEEALSTAHERNLIVVDLGERLDVDLSALGKLGFAGVKTTKLSSTEELPVLHSLKEPEVVAAGDVIRINPDTKQVHVLFRRLSTANSLFITERCNSYCLMCSQPPRSIDDDWRLEELRKLIDLIDPSTAALGVTGGEPTLLGARLADTLRHAARVLPETNLHVLTNGRTLKSKAVISSFDGLQGRVTWGVPLYADHADLHDYVVQSRGAFFETIEGLYNLAQADHLVEIRFVVSLATAPRIEAFSDFVYRNFPFVAHVAFMGLEPMGFAKSNRAKLWIDPADYSEAVANAAEALNDRGITTSLYNLPLCVLPRRAWRFAQRSISDWKQVYDQTCASCDVRDHCSGFFRSAGNEWKSRMLAAIKSQEMSNG